MAIGYDNIPLNYQQVLAITMREHTGLLAHSIARPNLPLNLTTTLHGPPAWTSLPLSNLSYLTFNPANPDWLDCSAVNSADLDFTVEDFTLAAWIYVTDLTANRMIICRGFLNTDGYYLSVLINGNLWFITNQAAANQISQTANGTIVINTWYLVGVSRNGAVATLFVNGQDLTSVAGVHIDPAACARELHVGIYDNEVGSPWSGGMWNPRAWLNRALTAEDWRKMFELERDLFGV